MKQLVRQQVSQGKQSVKLLLLQQLFAFHNVVGETCNSVAWSYEVVYNACFSSILLHPKAHKTIV